MIMINTLKVNAMIFVNQQQGQITIQSQIQFYNLIHIALLQCIKK